MTRVVFFLLFLILDVTNLQAQERKLKKIRELLAEQKKIEATELISELKNRGFNSIQQKAFKRYNFDIAIGNVAVEIHVATTQPNSTINNFSKLTEVTNCGWNIYYIWINPRKKVFSDVIYNDLIRFINFSQSDPTFIGHYRVIRGSGELYSSTCNYSD
jgi:hypothetical protein